MERLTKQVNAEEYWRSGGKLDRDSFEKAGRIQSVLAKGEIPWWVKNSSLSQAEGMAGFSGIPITLEQKYLYAVLREMTGEIEEKSDSPSETPETMPPWVLDDQLLLAEVFRLTHGVAKCNSFMNAYPNIFKTTR